jgi:hypothetical protein
MSFHGVQIDKPSANERPILNTTIQMMYQRYVSRKKRMRSMTYIIARVKATWFEQRLLPNNRSLQPWTVMRAITAIGLLKEDVRKK